MLIGFEWDAAKAKSNLKTHGVSFEETCTVFDDPLSLTIDDPDHSSDEKRSITIGQSRIGHLLVISHCDRPSAIRIISSRFATTRERQDYESGS
jgi:uncharacterized DUF497 family protein